jgi:hypothetical protein
VSKRQVQAMALTMGLLLATARGQSATNRVDQLQNESIGFDVFVEGKQHHAFFQGETVPVGFVVKNYLDRPASLEAGVVIRDFYKKAIFKKDFTFTVPAGGEHREVVPFNTGLKGIFLVGGYVNGNGYIYTYRRPEENLSSMPPRVLLEGETVFAILDKRPYERGEDPAGILGFHAHASDSVLLELAEKVGFKWVRLHDCSFATCWCSNEPEKGKWTFHDDELKAYRQNKFVILGSLHRTPAWASSAPEIPGFPKNDASKNSVYWKSQPRDWADYENYVRTVVSHYKPWIQYWEVWNEPHHTGFWTSTPEAFAELSRRTYAAAHAANPDAKVVGGGGLCPVALPWVEAFFKAGGAKGADIMSLHGYFDNVSPYSSKEYGGFLKPLVELTTRYGGPPQYWNTESSFGGCAPIMENPFLHNDNVPVQKDGYLGIVERRVFTTTRMDYFYGTLDVPKYSAMTQNAKGKNFLYYMVRGSGIVACNGVNNLGQLHASVVALNIWSAILEKTEYVADLNPAGHLLRGYLYRTPEARGKALIWGDFQDDVGIEVRLAKGNYRMLDVMGNAYPAAKDGGAHWVLNLTDARVYFESEALSPEELKSIILSATFQGEEVIRMRDAMMLARNKSDGETASERLQPFPEARKVRAEQWATVDLRRHCNQGFADDISGDGQGGWTDEGPFNDLRSIPLGRQVWCGVPFDILDPAKNSGKSCIALAGGYGLLFPSEAKGIAVNFKLKELYLLNGASWGDWKVASLYGDVHYADGSTERIPLKIGNWWNKPDDEEAARAVRVDVDNILMVGQSRDRYLRITRWVNPRPQVTITSLDLVSAKASPVPITVAITGVKGD